MSRIEQIGDATLYLGDCREILPTLGKVDAVVTDPPYGIGFKYESHDDTPDGYGDFISETINAAEQKCSEGAPIFVFQAMTNVRHFSKWFDKNFRIYVAAKNFAQIRPTAMQYAYDPVLVWWVGKEKPWSLGTANRDFYIANTAPVISNPNNLERGHPCPRPLDHMVHIVEQWCKPESIVLDPFMGSGTTGVACAKLGRKFIGIEIEPKYFDIACKRIEDVYRQPRLFTEEPQKPIQQKIEL